MLSESYLTIRFDLLIATAFSGAKKYFGKIEIGLISAVFCLFAANSYFSCRYLKYQYCIVYAMLLNGISTVGKTLYKMKAEPSETRPSSILFVFVGFLVYHGATILLPIFTGRFPPVEMVVYVKTIMLCSATTIIGIAYYWKIRIPVFATTCCLVFTVCIVVTVPFLVFILFAVIIIFIVWCLHLIPCRETVSSFSLSFTFLICFYFLLLTLAANGLQLSNHPVDIGLRDETLRISPDKPYAMCANVWPPFSNSSTALTLLDFAYLSNIAYMRTTTDMKTALSKL